MTTVDLTIVNVSLPTIGRDLHFSSTSLQWVVTAYALAYGGFLLLGGRIADLFGRRRVLMWALGTFAAASLGCALAANDAALIFGRAIQGLGAAVMLPTAMSIVTSMFDEGAERNKALGIWGVLGGTGGTIGLLTGGLITRYVGWQYVFYLNVPIGALVLMLAPRLLPRGTGRASSRRFDLPGAVVGTGGLVVLVDAISQAPQYGWAAARTIAMLAGSSRSARCVRVRRTADRVADPAAVDLPAANPHRRDLCRSVDRRQLLRVPVHRHAVHAARPSLHVAADRAGLDGGVRAVDSVHRGLAEARHPPRPAVRARDRNEPHRHGHHLGNPDSGPRPFLTDLVGPFALAGAGTAFSFIPISIAALTGVRQSQTGLASGLMNTSTQLGTAVGIAVASSVAAGATQALSHPRQPKNADVNHHDRWRGRADSLRCGTGRHRRGYS